MADKPEGVKSLEDYFKELGIVTSINENPDLVNQGLWGTYAPYDKSIEVRNYQDMPTTAHELVHAMKWATSPKAIADRQKLIDEAVKANPDYNFVYPRQWDRGYMEQGGTTPQTPQMQEMYNKSRIPAETFFGNEETVPTELAPMPGDDRQLNDRIRAYGLYMRDRGVAWPVVDKLVAGLRGDPNAATTALANMGQGNDTMLAHISPREAELLKAAGGSGTINPLTGLPEFDDSQAQSKFLGSLSGMAGSLLSGAGYAGLGSFFNLGGLMGGLFGGKEVNVPGIGNPNAWPGYFQKWYGESTQPGTQVMTSMGGSFGAEYGLPPGGENATAYNIRTQTNPYTRALMADWLNSGAVPKDTPEYAATLSALNSASYDASGNPITKWDPTMGWVGDTGAMAALGSMFDSSSGGGAIKGPKYGIQQPASLEIPIPQQSQQQASNPIPAYMASQQNAFNSNLPQPGSISALAQTRPDEVMRNQYMNQVYNNLLMKQFGA